MQKCMAHRTIQSFEWPGRRKEQDNDNPQIYSALILVYDKKVVGKDIYPVAFRKAMSSSKYKLLYRVGNASFYLIHTFRRVQFTDLFHH